MKFEFGLPEPTSSLNDRKYRIIFQTKNNRIIRFVLFVIIIGWFVIMQITVIPTVEKIVFILLVLIALPFYMDRYVILEETDLKWKMTKVYGFIIYLFISHPIAINSIEYRIVSTKASDPALLVIHSDNNTYKIKSTNRKLKEFQTKLEINSLPLEIRKRGLKENTV